MVLCQKMLRWQVSAALGRGEGRDLWLAMVGTRSVAPGFKRYPLHGASDWKRLASGKILAVARLKALLAPEEARKKFSKQRPDTG